MMESEPCSQATVNALADCVAEIIALMRDEERRRFNSSCERHDEVMERLAYIEERIPE